MADSFDELIKAHNAGDANATAELLERLYAELHRIAAYYMRGEARGHTLQTTALVNEAFLRLLGNGSIQIIDKDHFLNLAATTMRRILIDHARDKKRRGERVTLDDSWLPSPNAPMDWEAFGDAMEELSRLSERQTRVIDLRYFVGFTVEQTAAVLGVSERTIKGETSTAKAWLCRRLSV